MSEMILGSALFVTIVVVLGLIVMGIRTLLLPFHEVVILINGNRPITAQTGQKLLPALIGAGIPIPNACAGMGTCGLCRVLVTQGGGEPLPTEAARLSRAELREGKRLACQVTVREDLEVSVSEDLLAVETFACTIAETRMLSPLIREIVFDLPEGQAFDFRAGSFVQVTAPPYQLAYADIDIDAEHRSAWDTLELNRLTAHSDKPVTRAYSIASRPSDSGKIVLFIRLAVPPPNQPNAAPGIVSSYLFGVKPGDSVEVAGPYGTFGVQPTESEMVFIGGGVGMAPLRAMIHEQLEQGTNRKISFWYGARSKADLFYADEFDALAAKYENFTWTPALSDPTSNDGWKGATGFIHSVILGNYLKTHPAPQDCEYYLCGPPLMIQSVYSMLDECGVDETSIFNDDFGA